MDERGQVCDKLQFSEITSALEQTNVFCVPVGNSVSFDQSSRARKCGQARAEKSQSWLSEGVLTRTPFATRHSSFSSPYVVFKPDHLQWTPRSSTAHERGVVVLAQRRE